MTSENAPPVSRVLMAAVIGMGVLIVLGTATLVGVVVTRALHPHAAIPATAAARELALPVATGTRVGALAARPDGTIAVTLMSPGGDRVVIWDPAAGRTVASLFLTP